MDGSSKQRGHLESPAAYARQEEALLPSGSAAFYRREMLEEIGLFDESFFLYCEDTDLGLRARWAGWECLYVPEAQVEHRYSHSSGQASPLKAYYVERNRLFVIFKNFPVPDLLLVPFYATSRYFWHLLYALGGRGKAAEFQRAGGSFVRLPWYVVRGHFELLLRFPDIWRPAPQDEATPYRQTIPTPDPALLHQSASGGCSVKPAGGPHQFLVLIPAFNEVGAIAGVIREVRGVVPGAPILVVDDASTDGTDGSAREAGANVLRLPYHLGLGGVVQAGYKLAFELGYEYVIRVDGDGQHDPKYIPALLETLRETGCHMVIGSRFQDGNGEYTSSVRAIGIWFFRLVLRPILGKPVSDPTSGFVGVNRQALQCFHR